jgi:hypothetical protein
MVRINKKSSIYGWCILIIVLVISLIFIYNNEAKSEKSIKTAFVYSDDKLIKKIRLDKVSKTYSFKVESESGYNIVEVRKDSIGIKSADCPDKLCVEIGFIRNGSKPLVCLPNKLVIKIETSDKDVEDAVVY